MLLLSPPLLLGVFVLGDGGRVSDDYDTPTMEKMDGISRDNMDNGIYGY